MHFCDFSPCIRGVSVLAIHLCRFEFENLSFYSTVEVYWWFQWFNVFLRTKVETNAILIFIIFLCKSLFHLMNLCQTFFLRTANSFQTVNCMTVLTPFFGIRLYTWEKRHSRQFGIKVCSNFLVRRLATRPLFQTWWLLILLRLTVNILCMFYLYLCIFTSYKIFLVWEF